MRSALRGILLTALIVGTMDITAAIIMAIARGATAMRLLQFVASGVLGRRAFDGGISTAALGLALHFAVALGVVLGFHLLRCWFAFAREQAVVSGIVYGLLVDGVMNLVVLPLSAARPRHALVPDLIQIAIHCFVIGLPTSLLLRRFGSATRG